MFENELKKRQKGTGFTNIGKIVGANVGAGQQMAGKIAQGIQTAGQKTQQQLGQAKQQFKSGFQQSVDPTMANLQAGSNIAKRTDESDDQYAERIKNQGIDYSEIGKKVQEAKYGGPQGLENVKNLVGGATNVGQLGALSSSALGQQQLLKQFAAGRAGYTGGQGALDQFLLGQSAEGQKQLKQARESVSGIAEDVKAAARSAQLQALGMGEGIEKEKSRVLGGVQGSISEMDKRAQERGQQQSRDAKRLVSILTDPSAVGKISGPKGTEYNEQQALYDKNLLKNIEKFGIETGVSLDTSNKEAMIRNLQEIASRADTAFTTRYGDPQRAALQKLFQFQQDEGKAAKIAAEKEKNVFKLGEQDIKGLQAVKEEDVKRQSEESLVKDIPRLENIVNKRGQVSHLDYMSMASDILGADVVNSIRRRMDDENGRHDWFGASDGYIDAVTDSAVQEAIRQKLNPLYQARSSLDKRAKSQMALQDYINKTYGLS